MSTLQQLREGMDRAWETLQAGWRTLTQKATQALTLFRPAEREDDDEDHRALRAASPGWGLLAAEVREDDSEVCVRLEAPGLEPDQFDIQVLERILVVSGEKAIAREERRGRYHITERAYGRFERAIPLPTDVDESRASADYRRGVLTVRLPKHPRVSSRRITVQGG
jgi:HSP20 family protein